MLSLEINAALAAFRVLAKPMCNMILRSFTGFLWSMKPYCAVAISAPDIF